MPSYERYETHRRQTYGAPTARTAWGYWIPLIVTVGIATAGVAAWVWNEHKDDDEDDDEDYSHPAGPSGGPPPVGYARPPPGADFDPAPGMGGPSAEGYGPPSGGIRPGVSDQHAATSVQQRDLDEESLVSRMSGAFRRTPSPQQMFDVASKRVTAGVAAAGAVVGGALASITEESKGDYEDHSRWSEEADSQNGSSRTGPQLRDNEAALAADQALSQARAGSKPGRKRTTVALVVSAESGHEYKEDAEYHQEHASILSHLPYHIDETSRVFVLIYDPTLKEHPLSSNGQRIQSMASSYSNIGPDDAQSPSPSAPSKPKKFETLYRQAQAIVDKETMIMPFTTPSAFVQMLRQLTPETLYLQANLAGPRGEQLDAVKNWVGQIVIVVGDESGHGGLVDSEDEAGKDGRAKWWLEDSRIGLGKGIEVVEGLRIGEDWGRRINGHD